MSGINIRLNVEPPLPFSDPDTSTAAFEEFKKRLRNYMNLHSIEVGKIIGWIMSTVGDEKICDKEITFARLQQYDLRRAAELRAELGERAAPITYQNTAVGSAGMFYYILSGLVKGTPYGLIDTIEDGNGYEAWRKLYNRYKPNLLQSLLLHLVHVVRTKFPDNKDFENTFMNWEREVTKLERAMGQPLPDIVKCGLLIAGTQGKLFDHLCLNAHTIGEYNDVRVAVLSYIQSRSIHTSLQPRRSPGYDGDHPMDGSGVHGTWRGRYTKGKDKGKGYSGFSSKAYLGQPKGSKGKSYKTGKGK